jgi:hypothetical protein
MEVETSAVLAKVGKVIEEIFIGLVYCFTSAEANMASFLKQKKKLLEGKKEKIRGKGE